MAETPDAGLWMWILDRGGIRRSKCYWDSHVSIDENRRAYRFLDRVWGKGTGVDVLAEEIAQEFPYAGIATGDDLWAWLEETS